MKTENAIECGARCELFSHGMLKAQFSPDNKIKKLELEFDVMSFMQQQQRALVDGEFRVVPNTVSFERWACDGDHDVQKPLYCG